VCVCVCVLAFHNCQMYLSCFVENANAFPIFFPTQAMKVYIYIYIYIIVLWQVEQELDDTCSVI